MKYFVASTDLSEWFLPRQFSISVGEPPKIGKSPTIRQPMVIYEGVEIGDNFETGHFVLIRENTKIGHNVRIGSYSDLDGDLTIGDNFQCHSRCHISKGVWIGKNVRFMFNVTTLNDIYPPMGHYHPPVIEDNVLVASNVIIMPGSRIQAESFVPANTVVKGTWKSNAEAYRRLLRQKGYDECFHLG